MDQRHKLILKAIWMFIKESLFTNSSKASEASIVNELKVNYKKYAILINDLGYPQKEYDRITVTKGDKIVYPSGYCADIYYYDSYAGFLPVLYPDVSVDLTELKNTVFNNPNVRDVAKQIPDIFDFE